MTYGGIPLDFAHAAAAGWADWRISLREVSEFAAVADWPGRSRLSWPAVPSHVPDRPVKVGSLWWPPDARNFAVGHFLATEEQLAVLRPLVYAAKSYRPLTLALDDGRYPVSTSLWMLPPRPLTQRAGVNGLYLATFVDDRFWWWQRAAVVEISPGVTTWPQLFTAVGTALGVTITTDTIEAEYLLPPASLASSYDYLPLLLDAACASVGHRLVRRWQDGAVFTQQALTAKASQDVQKTKYQKQAGGQYAFMAGA